MTNNSLTVHGLRMKRAELATDAAELDERLNEVRFNLQHLGATLRLSGAEPPARASARKGGTS